MTKFDWTSTNNRLAALREEIDEDDQDLENEGEGEEEQVEGLSELHLAALAEMLDVSVEDLLQADEETIAEAMSYVGYQLVSTQYGRPGLTGKYPWNKNESPVGVASPHATPTATREPGEGTAKVPSQSTSPFSQKGVPHISK